MSFYDLTKDFVLSAKELFKYRVKRDSTIPSKGGQKDFEPDGSWIQSKALEAFMQERTSVLAEPRVEKLKSLVEGVWDGEQRLVNVQKLGKFWAHMGFTDQRRNWLYPEEALFLMESNCLEVLNCGVPLSIQEAFDMFLGPDISLEEYQVFAHLRRLGYVVLRHEEQPIITPYERQMNLDKYMSKQSRRERKGKGLQKGKAVLKQKSKNIGKQDSKKNITKSKVATTEAETAIANTGAKPEDIRPVATTQFDNQSGKILSEECESNTEISLDESGHLHQNLGSSVSDSETVFSSSNPSYTETKDNLKNSNSQASSTEKNNTDGNSSELISRKRHRSDDIDASLSAKKIHCEENMPANSEVSMLGITDSDIRTPQVSDLSDSTSRFYENQWHSCFQLLRTKTKARKFDTVSETSETTVDRNKIEDTHLESHNCETSPEKSAQSSSVCLTMPNIAGGAKVGLSQPHSRLLPENVELNEKEEELFSFDIEDYRLKNPPPPISRHAQRQQERDSQISSLAFSFAEWMERKLKVTAGNWKEYKEKVEKRKTEMASTTPADHLWQGKVTPLVRPQDAWSTESILDHLRIIKSADCETLFLDSDCVVDVRVTFDVHLPDSSFKKSMPGIPNHRVCVTKCSSELPGLSEFLQVTSRFKDDVPLHWAVIDSGEIAFYVFDSSRKIELLS